MSMRRLCKVLLFVAVAAWFWPAHLEAQVTTDLDVALKPSQSSGGNIAGKLHAGTAETVKRLMDLWAKEFQILKHLLLNPTRVFSRDELLNQVWGTECALEEHTLDVHIHSLRHKIEPDPTHPRFIVTVRGVGYKLSDG